MEHTPIERNILYLYYLGLGKGKQGPTVLAYLADSFRQASLVDIALAYLCKG